MNGNTNLCDTANTVPHQPEVQASLARLQQFAEELKGHASRLAERTSSVRRPLPQCVSAGKGNDATVKCPLATQIDAIADDFQASCIRIYDVLNEIQL